MGFLGSKYSDLCHLLKIKFNINEESVSMPVKSLETLVKAVLQNVDINEKLYEFKYPDVKELTEKSDITATEHFRQYGYFEGRFLIPLDFDEGKYLEFNPDIEEAVRNGEINSALDHYLIFGRKQQRRA
jgi:hypothetical protein